MAELVIKGDGIFASIPVIDVGDPPDYTQIASVSVDTDWSGTLSDPVTIWQSGTAYIQSYHYIDSQGYSHYAIKYYPLSGWEWGTPTPPWTAGETTSYDKIYIASCVTGNRGFVWISSDDNFPSQLYLYNGTKDNLIAQTEVNTNWDDTPSEDENNPFNENAIGGEFADRGAFDENDLMLLEDMPDPHADEMGFGGLIMCYALHEIELVRISESLFLPNFWTSLKNKFEGLSDPMSFILDAVELPLPITDYGIGPFKLGGIKVQDSGGNDIGCATYPYRFKKYDMGTIALKEVWGSEKDYSCTTISIFLPYVGVKELDPDIVLNSRLTLVLYVDRWNGDILYLLHASNNLARQKYYRQENVVYRFAGNCGRKVPLGRVDNSNQIIQAVSGLAGIGAGYAMGGVVGAVGGAVPTIQNIAAGNFKPTVQTSGGVSGNTGRMDYQQAYLIIKRGVPEYPNGWRGEMGAPRNQMLTISSLSGYTLFSTVYLENIECMAEEKAELERLLTTEGVIL